LGCDQVNAPGGNPSITLGAGPRAPAISRCIDWHFCQYSSNCFRSSLL